MLKAIFFAFFLLPVSFIISMEREQLVSPIEEYIQAESSAKISEAFKEKIRTCLEKMETKRASELIQYFMTINNHQIENTKGRMNDNFTKRVWAIHSLIEIAIGTAFAYGSICTWQSRKKYQNFIHTLRSCTAGIIAIPGLCWPMIGINRFYQSCIWKEYNKKRLERLQEIKNELGFADKHLNWKRAENCSHS